MFEGYNCFMYIRISWKQNNLRSFQVIKMLKFSLSAKHACWNLLRKIFSSECSTYSRIQGRHLKCSKRTSFIGNTSWPDSPKPMKIYVNIGLNRLFTWHTRLRYMVLFTVSYFLLKILRIPDNERKKNLQFFYSFYSQETHRDATTELYN